MFNQLVVSGVQGKTHKPWAVAMSAVAESMLLGILVLIPLIYTQALPKTMLSRFLVAPAQPPQPPSAATSKAVRAIRVIKIEDMLSPGRIPTKILMLQDDQPIIIGNNISTDADENGKLPTDITSSAPPAPLPAPTKRISLGGKIESAALINKIMPEYPPPAIFARISGTVVLRAIIAKDGTVQELQYVSGPALLMKAAMDAVKQWRYKPTMLNGEPVEVDTTIDVVFNLGS